VSWFFIDVKVPKKFIAGKSGFGRANDVPWTRALRHSMGAIGAAMDARLGQKIRY